MDGLGIIIGFVIIVWLILAIYSNIKKQKIKETISDLRDWIIGKVKKK
jgi:hypothetical protein